MFSLAGLAILTTLSLLPGSTFPEISWSAMLSLDKIAHVVIYMLLFLVIARDQKLASGYSQRKGMLILLFLSGYGVLLEVLQQNFFTGRYFEVLDIIANIIGLIVGLLLAGPVFKWIKL